MTSTRIAAAAFVLTGLMVGTLSVRTPLFAQGERRGGQEADAIAALVSELRDLRVELAATSQRSLRAQVLLGRLQMQDQRLAYIDQRRAEATTKALEASRASADLSGRVDALEECRDRGTPEQRRECDEQLKAIKGALTNEQTRELQMRNQENDLTNALAQEQARWSEISARLDELERSLAR